MTRETPGRAARAVGRAETLQPFLITRDNVGELTNCGRRVSYSGERGGNERVGRARDLAEEMMRKRPVYLVSTLHP